VEQGLTNAYLEESLIDRAILNNASQVIIVADHTKCGRVSAVFVAPLSTVDFLVTDDSAPPEFVAALRSVNVEVVIV
jgi:DeoR/GlpR family transcriptional regulator of sugar metabolism